MKSARQRRRKAANSIPFALSPLLRRRSHLSPCQWKTVMILSMITLLLLLRRPPRRKKHAKRNAITSSSDSLASEDESSPRKTREGILNKSPRKSKDHTYPKGLDDDMTRKTIRDIQHPSRPRATSPTPMRRTPLKSASAPSQIARSDSTLQPSSNANAPKGPIFISDSEDDDKPPPPRFVPNLKPPAKSAKPRPKSRTLLPGHLKASDVPNPNLRPELKTCSSRWTSSDADLNVGRHVGSDDDDIPPLLRARARSKAKLAGTGRQANAKVTTTNAVDVIELSD
ncbi:hypothetical protein BT96DRAFT_460817 [Gymnopus androsaceus JB14]|uniref:Uncharacterized protein n=1 Tax=Gymnopus androsaceus JB14 TaxID=1447944 RepID=A0A6A4IH64_9AGAR|nr:hypothetical protein BT96DRAFT_460817 [Gymnopus androsaceus JB14]